MRILKYGNSNNKKVILIHGFQMCIESLKTYIDSLKDNYCVIVPILPAHDIEQKEEFINFDICLEEIEEYYSNKFNNDICSIIAFSMGGVFASMLWERKKIKIDKLIMESSPLLKWNKLIIKMMTKQYLRLTKAARNRNDKIINQAINSIVLKENLNSFLILMDNMSNQSIINYLNEVGNYNLSKTIEEPNPDIYYIYGSKIQETIFKKVAKYIIKHYKNVHIECLENKGHCEDIIFHPKEKVKELLRILQ
ncbi:MAG: hypothetical protein Q4G04_00915 [bacterium]|nr:hypothetical protein [bacterium]